VDKLNYALLCDSKYSIGTDKNLFITCGDQLVSPRLPVYINNRKKEIHYLQIPMMLNTDFKFVKYSFNKCSDFL
ncbi:MAG: Adenylosuccinate synthetase, partial [Chitinophagaceae bacterium]|nr:Adenylosuccinate synthetase [Chitinophagaceae bacterium]